MGARVADTVFNIMIRKIIVIPDVFESKLENPHSRKFIGIPELFHRRCDDAEIFGNDRQGRAEGFNNMVEEIISGAFFPLAANGCFFTVRNGPESFKATKMVDAELSVS